MPHKAALILHVAAHQARPPLPEALPHNSAQKAYPCSTLPNFYRLPILLNKEYAVFSLRIFWPHDTSSHLALISDL
jgi:hypothetical protein